MEQLAIFGGKPVREQKIFYGRQCVDETDVDAVRNVLLSDFITCGPAVKNWKENLPIIRMQNTPLWFPTEPQHFTVPALRQG